MLTAAHRDTLQLVAGPRRRAILALVWDRERTAGEIARHLDDVTFGAISQQLKILRDAGAVSVRVDGPRRWYRARPEVLGPVAAALEAEWAERLEALKVLSETREREER